MRGFLLDTNVISELKRPKPAVGVLEFLAGRPRETLCVSEVTFAEIRFGIEEAPDPPRRAEIKTWLDQSIRPWMGARALPVTENVMLRWRLMTEAGRRRYTFGQPDLIIAATAADSDLIVVSRDMKHFVAAGVPILNPWNGRYVSALGREDIIADLGSPLLLGRLS